LEKYRITGYSKGNFEGKNNSIRGRDGSLTMVSALYLRMSFQDNKIPHLIAERFPGKATSIDLTYITKRERENNYLSGHIFQLPSTK
jgi:hypothetical protein